MSPNLLFFVFILFLACVFIKGDTILISTLHLQLIIYYCFFLIEGLSSIVTFLEEGSISLNSSFQTFINNRFEIDSRIRQVSFDHLS